MTNSDDLLRRASEHLEIDHNHEAGLIPHATRKLANDLVARIRYLKAELALYKDFHDGVCETGTHVIVPVEPTELMLNAAFNAYDGGRMSKQFVEIYRAMIKAAQEKNDG
jgi:hypothetical protein